jgi:hypothetical protein
VKIYAYVCSRAFGDKDIPSACIVPMADNFNHSNACIVWEFVNKELHLNIDPDHYYFSADKYMNNFKPIFDRCSKT